MSHLMPGRGIPCGCPDGHKGDHRSPEALNRNREHLRELMRQKRLSPHPCGNADCNEPAERQSGGGYDNYCKVHRQERDRRQHDRNKAAVFGHYGQSCACCGTTENLTIDHIDGTGGHHRMEIGAPGSTNMYRWLVAKGYPEGFQVLCFPCNRSKRNGERCRLDHAPEGGM